MLASSGDSGPPCGTPFSLGLTCPFSITPARRKRQINRRTTGSDTLRFTRCMRISKLTVSKNLAKSMSTATG